MDENHMEGTQKLGFSALIAMVVGSMIGAGIFMLPRRFADASGVYGTLVTWAVAGIGMLMLAFVFQLLAIRKPTLNTGVFAYAKAGFGDYVGFIVAIGFWASACAGNVTYLVLIKSTLGSFFPALGEGDSLLAIAISSVVIWLFFALILRGVKQAATINVIATLAKLVPLVIFIVAIIVAFDPRVFSDNLMGVASSGNETLFSQVRQTMLITVFVFLGIEGASIYSRLAKKRKDVGKATVLGFLLVLALLVAVTLLSYGVLPRAEIAQLRQPSLAGILESSVGSWGGLLISFGLIISVLGAYLAWTLLSAEVLFAASEGNDMPGFIKKTTSKGVPKNALLMSAILTQLILIVTYFSDGALDFALELTSALALLPFFLTAVYSAKLILGKDRGLEAASQRRPFDYIVSILATIYTAFLIYAAGWHYLLLSCLLLAPSSVLFFRARKEKGLRVFSTTEKIILAILTIGAILAIVGLAVGWIVI
ncbi:MAG: basic amino acid/polyamine antiporter [Dehalococcoidia bacterium]|nr:basic amino acid/polyamine antiporter [Dehalococcoidia bacterium]